MYKVEVIAINDRGRKGVVTFEKKEIINYFGEKIIPFLEKADFGKIVELPEEIIGYTNAQNFIYKLSYLT